MPGERRNCSYPVGWRCRREACRTIPGNSPSLERGGRGAREVGMQVIDGSSPDFPGEEQPLAHIERRVASRRIEGALSLRSAARDLLDGGQEDARLRCGVR